MDKPTLVRVSKVSRPSMVAGAIAGITRGGRNCNIRAVGPYAIHQAVKAIALATTFLEEDGISLRVSLKFQVLPDCKPEEPVSADSLLLK